MKRAKSEVLETAPEEPEDYDEGEEEDMLEDDVENDDWDETTS